MKNIYVTILCSLLLVIACDNDLDQVPPNIASSDSLEDFGGVLNAAYFYQLGSVTPMAVMGDFRADNGLMQEEPYPSFDRFNGDLVDMEDQFFGPLYTALYKSILSANNVIENSSNPVHVGEAKFLRALSYFKLTLAFGDVPVNLSPNPSTTDNSILARTAQSQVYSSVIIPDLNDAISALGNNVSSGRATRIAAQALLGKVYVHTNDFASAESQLAAVVSGAAGAGVSLEANFADIFVNDLNSEIIFATQISSSVPDEYGFSEFWSWSGGLDTKSLEPLDASLISAFDASPGDLRRGVTIDEAIMSSPKFPQTGGPEHDWIEIRLADVILLYAESLNANGKSNEAIAQLNKIRSRAGLSSLDATSLSSSTAINEAIHKERRLELAFEGHRWFDLTRTATAQAALGQSFGNEYYLFPVPISEILVSSGVITQNSGY